MIQQFAQVIRESLDIQPISVPNILTGFSGHRLLGTLQNLSHLFKDDPSACYLEVGVFQGLTLLSVADHSNELACFGVDNFSFEPDETSNFDIVKSRIDRLKLQNVNIINKDFELAFDEMDASLEGRKIAVYFIDGPHDYRSQLMCLEYALPYLHENAVIIIDDSNYNHVRQANRDFLHTHADWKLLYEAYTPAHPANMTTDDLESAKLGWWDGVNILVSDTENILSNAKPPTIKDKTHFFNDHVIHGSRKVEIGPDAVEFVQYLLGMRLIKALSRLKNIISHKADPAIADQKRFEHSNTFASDLPTDQFNSSL